jgi:hypothetical protein
MDPFPWSACEAKFVSNLGTLVLGAGGRVGTILACLCWTISTRDDCGINRNTRSARPDSSVPVLWQ